MDDPNSTPESQPNRDKRKQFVLGVIIAIALLTTLISVAYHKFSDIKTESKADTPGISYHPPVHPPKPKADSSPPKTATKEKTRNTISQPETDHLEVSISGKWQTDFGTVWEISQHGNEVTIIMKDKKGNWEDEIQAQLEGRTLSYQAARKGKDKKGSFHISSDGKSMNGRIIKMFGMVDHVSLSKIE